ncbi:hypothetical protein L484_020335 [Morus notabilis]|uniref:Aminotransferase-like plant mobile domain-containing protein n=1 Tax=Morus notabilis TaxID=981085 RepID=W9S449_9ROSA|nr:hypothetical protein L484_020335 [Morus notabilis]
MYLPLLNLEEIDDYAWGAATLGTLKCAMKNVVKGCEREKSKMLEGFSLALMVFALERFPSVRGLVPKPTEFPLILGWMKKIKEKTTKNEPCVAEVISFFSQIKVDDIDWLPYCEPNRMVTLPAKHCSQLWIKYARVPCICFQHIAYYRADLCHRQLDLERKDVKLKSITNVKLMNLSRHKDKDWRTHTNGYTKANTEWKDRNKYLVKKGVDVGQLLNYSDDDLAPDFDNYDVKQSQEECKKISRIGKPVFIKQLAKVWEKYTQYNETNTLLVDDSPYKAICNPANTGIFPLSYDCARFDDNSLGLGGDIQMYLDRLAMTNNVQEFVKKNPFGKLPITETHVDLLK